MKKVLLLMGMIFSATALFAQTTYYVATTGDDANDGTSWANAKKTIAATVTAITDPASSQVFVKAGVYTVASGNVHLALVAANSGLKLYGGFAGTETCLCDRTFTNARADSTTLQGNNARIISNSGNTGVVIDGFTIEGGKSANGAGMSIGGNADIAVANCIFKGNIGTTSSGGAIYSSSCNVTFTDCKFYANTAKTAGGALILSTGASGTLVRCLFDGNTAETTSGGAVSTYTDVTKPTTNTFTDCVFTRNTAFTSGGGLYLVSFSTISVSGCTFSNNKANIGAGTYRHTSSVNTISNSSFTGNIATTNGGGIYNASGANGTISNCSFTENIANTNGGGIYNTAGSGTITNCTFTSNEAKSTTSGSGGGGLFSVDANPNITYCKFLGNKASNGAAIVLANAVSTKLINNLFAGNMATNAGGAAYINNGTGKTCTPTFINCTIAGNNATTTGGGIYNTGAASSNGTNTVVTNCIIYDNNSGITNSAAAGASSTVTYSNVQFEQFGAVTNEGDYSSGTGNLSTDPLFVNSPVSSSAPFITGDYNLKTASVSINAGLNAAINGYTTDLAGFSRIYNNVKVDMGTYEYQGVLPVTVTSFSANLVNNRTELKWSAGKETNVNRYEVERSQNGVDFLKVAGQAANGSSSYNTTDANPKLGINYYRLLSIDNDGTIGTYVEVQTVKVSSLSAESIQVYPNPVKGNVINVILNGYSLGDYTYKLVNATGATVQKGNVNYNGSNLSIATSASAGVYVLYLSNGKNVIKAKVVKQ